MCVGYWKAAHNIVFAAATRSNIANNPLCWPLDRQYFAAWTESAAPMLIPSFSQKYLNPSAQIACPGSAAESVDGGAEGVRDRAKFPTRLLRDHSHLTLALTTTYKVILQ